jgi:hypothetical protein
MTKCVQYIFVERRFGRANDPESYASGNVCSWYTDSFNSNSEVSSVTEVYLLILL